MADVIVRIDSEKLKRAINDDAGFRDQMQGHVRRISGNANAMGATFTTERTTNWATHEKLGGKSPRYAGDVQKHRGELVGLVHPDNYAAMKDNMLHNTLLKSI